MKDYIEQAIRTESPATPLNRISFDTLEERLLHASMGMVTEAGEFQDVLKKNLFYGKPIDFVNLTEELGDMFWYIAIACDVLGVSFEEVQERNIAKLKARYPQKFTEHHAENRDLVNERRILES